MQGYSPKSFILGCVCSAAVMGGMLSLRPVPAEAQISGAKWEYQILTGGGLDGLITRTDLNNLGKDGWEIAMPYATRIIFKRRK